VRILIIGGTRFIGPAVARQLHTDGHIVTIFHRGHTEVDLPADITHVHADRSHLPSIMDELRELAPEVVVDMAPMVEEDSRIVMRVFKGIARRVVAISSMDVYRAYGRLWGTEPGPVDAVPLTEDAPLREKLYSLRGQTLRDPRDPERWKDDYEKILVERVVMRDPNLPGTVLRLPMVYGPNDGHRFVYQASFQQMVDRRPAILMDGGLAQWRASWGYVDNVAGAVAHVATDSRASGKIYNVAEPEAQLHVELVRRLGNAVGWHGDIIPLPKDRLPRHVRWGLDTSQHWVLDTSRIRNELGYAERVPQDEALQRTVAWELVNPVEPRDPTGADYAAEDAILAELGHDRG
jgi:nucleoside-diphosphate-sugar epimerase